MPFRLIAALAPVLCLFVASCTTVVVRTMQPILEEGALAVESETDLRFAREAMAGNLKLLEGVYRSDPGQDDVRLLLMRGFSGYAMAFLEREEPARAATFYRRARDLGMEWLREQSGFSEAFDAGAEALEKQLRRWKTERKMAFLYWTAASWGLVIQIRPDDPAEVAYLGRIKAMMQRVADRMPEYYFAGADTFLGAIEAAVPQALGGNPEKAREHFEKALALNERKFLLTLFFYARHYAIGNMKTELAKSLLHEIVRTDPKVLPDAALANAVAIERARKVLKELGENATESATPPPEFTDDELFSD